MNKTDKNSGRVREFINRAFNINQDDTDLVKMVSDYGNPLNYSIGFGSDVTSNLGLLREVPAMLKDPIIQSSLSAVMENSFQPNADQNVFWVKSNYEVIKTELDKFHASISAQDFILTVGFNLLLWGNLPSKSVFNDNMELVRVVPIPDFTKVVPIVISGKTLGYMVDGAYHYPYEYAFAQLKYYKNLGGIYRNNLVQLGVDSSSKTGDSVENEFVIAPSYLSTAAKPWRNISIIEDALLLNRMDQSNYYRIFSVNVGTSVYSKSAIKILNFYRNLFKKVRRVSYDSNGMAAKGNGSDFEVVLPKTSNQGVEVTNVGGEIDVKALKDLDVQYQRLFSALRIQPSMIGFSSEVPSTLGDTPAKVWDERFSKVCKSLVYSSLSYIKELDFVYLRSRGYDVKISDWSYGTVSTSISEDQQKQDALKGSIENLKSLTDRLTALDISDYNKSYLVEALLGSSLSSVGVDVKKLLNLDTADKKPVLNSAWKHEYLKSLYSSMRLAGVVSDEECSALTSSLGSDKDKVFITSSFDKSKKVTFEQFASGNQIIPDDVEFNLSSVCKVFNKTEDEMRSDFDKTAIKETSLATCQVATPVIIPSDLVLTVGDLNRASIQALNEGYVNSKGDLILLKKEDLAVYLYMKLSGLSSCIISKYIEVNL